MDGFQMPPPPTLGPDAPALGAFVIGSTFSLVLAGTVTVQCFDYTATACAMAPKALLGLALAVTLPGLLQASLGCYFDWLWVVQGYGNPLALDAAPWSYAWSIFLFGFVATLCQLYYAWQVYKVAPPCKALIVSAITSLALHCGVFSLILSIKINASNQSWPKVDSYGWMLLASLWGLSASTAAAATLLLVYQRDKLVRAEGETTISWIDRLIGTFFRVNGLSALVLLIEAIYASASSIRGWHNLVLLPLIQLYASACIASLNSAFHAEIDALEASYSTSPSSGLHSAADRSKRFGSALDSAHQRFSTVQMSGIIEEEINTEKQDPSTHDGSATEVGSDCEKDSPHATPTFALRAVVAHPEPIHLANHPYATTPPLKPSEAATTRHPYAAPAHQKD
ncbi:hypothetical protein JCM10908_006735 [Rhodotorula pacifica]|uniref:uncharacterized protein n=1 Tax=Rhodotorula pacifica TaxID=1495444 RepID=UPI00316F8622